MDEKLAFNEALNLSMKEVSRFNGNDFSLEKDKRTIERWFQHSGRKWVTDRLKSLKVTALKILSGDVEHIHNYNGRKTTVKGVRIPALRIFSLLLSAQKANNFKLIRSILDVLNIYNVFKGPNYDLESKIQTIIEPPRQEFDHKEVANIKATIVKHFPLSKRVRPYIMKFMGPDIGGARYAREPRINSSSLEALIPSLSFIPEWIWKSVPEMSEWVLDHPYFSNVSKYHRTLFSQGSSVPSPYWGGNLALLSESGLKTRIVFIANPWIQGILRPAMVLLQRQILKLGTDCTFDQDHGRRFMKEKLSMGTRLHSVDLSSATDNFPFFLQRFVGEMLGIPKYVLDLIKFIGFKSPLDKSDETLYTYGKGQPMGLYPSFVLFALTHNILLHSLARELKLDPIQSFRILGDDVIIADDALANEYRKCIETLSVPISENKSFSSHNLGEFAGSVYWKGYDITPIKWRPVTPSSINVISQYIERNLVKVDYKSNRLTKIPLADPKVYPLANALYPIPKELGGFGQLTRVPITERLRWGRRRVRSLRAGYLALFSERIYRFLSPQELRGIDITKFVGLADQLMKWTDFLALAREKALMAPPGAPVPFIMGDPTSKREADLPSSREGLKGLESLVFSKDSLEERLGKYHMWHIATLGPNPVREFNRMSTIAGSSCLSLNVPILSVSDTKALLPRVRCLHPSLIDEKFDMAIERLAMLRGIRLQLQKKPDSFDEGVNWGKVGATAAATLVNPLAGLVTLGLAHLTEQSKDKIPCLDKLVPLMDDEILRTRHPK